MPRSGSSNPESGRPARVLVLLGVATLVAAILVVVLVRRPLDGGTDVDPTIGSDPTVAAASSTDDPTTTSPAADESAGAAATTAPPATVDPAEWEPCPEDDELECATVAVPVDHGRPDGPRLDLALVRVPATGPTDGVAGTIFVNPGGPGGSGVRYVRNGFRLDPATLARYHLVGFDPRGIGGSAPLTCAVDLIADGPDDLSPDEADERRRLDERARALAAACGAGDRDLLPHLTTEAVAADLDLLRRAVGDDRLHYIGFSYGTLLALRYAEAHPDRVGHLVLDGVVDPDAGLTGLLAQQAAAFDAAFATLAAACGDTITCPADGIVAAYDRTLARLEADGGTGPGDALSPAAFELATLTTLYAESLWPRYGDALVAADRGDDEPLAALYRRYAGGFAYTAYLAFSCLDSPHPVGAAAWDGFAAELATISPRFGETLANEVRACAHWPTPGPADMAREPFTLPDATPILVVSTTGDAATPVANAERLAAALDDSLLVLVDDDSHTAYRRSPCVQELVAAYFGDDEVALSEARDRIEGGAIRC